MRDDQPHGGAEVPVHEVNPVTVATQGKKITQVHAEI